MDNVKVVSIWKELSKSPVLTEFMWSPMVNWVYERFVHRMASMPDSWEIPDPKTKYTIPGLLVVAIRRGDFSVRQSLRPSLFLTNLIGSLS